MTPEELRALPKAELHVHLEGSLEPELLVELARRNDVAIPWRTAEELRSAYRFEDLQSFLDLFYAGCQVMVTERDFRDVTHAYLTRAMADGVVHAEVFLGPQAFTSRGIPVADVIGGTLRGIEEARAETGISAGLLVSIHRHRTEDEAFALLVSVSPWAAHIVGYGMGGPELPHPPAKFERYFRELATQGFPACAHAGEEGPADYVRDTVELLGVRRVDHGVRVLDDEALTNELAASAMPFTVCPVSNVKLKVSPSLAAHPLPRMLSRGLNVSLNSDDPAYFENYLADTYADCAAAFGLDDATLKTLADNSIRASFLDEETKARLLSPASPPAPSAS